MYILGRVGVVCKITILLDVACTVLLNVGLRDRIYVTHNIWNLSRALKKAEEKKDNKFRLNQGGQREGGVSCEREGKGQVSLIGSKGLWYRGGGARPGQGLAKQLCSVFAFHPEVIEIAVN